MFALTSPEISTALHPALSVPTDSTVTVPVVSSFVTEIFGASGLPHGLDRVGTPWTVGLQFTLLWARRRSHVRVAVGNRVVIENKIDSGGICRLLGRRVPARRGHLVIVHGEKLPSGSLPRDARPCCPSTAPSHPSAHQAACPACPRRRWMRLDQRDLVPGLHLERVGLAVLQPVDETGGLLPARALAGRVSAPHHLVFGDRAAVGRTGRPCSDSTAPSCGSPDYRGKQRRHQACPSPKR